MFSDAVAETTTKPGKYVEPKQHFFHEAEEQAKHKAMAANMTRQQLFNNGFIGVEDLDDEELRLGKCRNTDGSITGAHGRTEMVRRDLYDEMIAEHEKRTDEKLRQQLDIAIDTMVDIMTDDTVEPRDRFEASKYLFERVKGKTPEKVSVTVKQEPWQELLGGVAKITRQQSLAQREAIDAELVAAPGDSDDPIEPTGRTQAGDLPGATPQEPDTRDRAPTSPGAGEPRQGPDVGADPTQTPLEAMGYGAQGDIADIRIKPPGIAPTWEHPVNPSATMGEGIAEAESKSAEIRRVTEEALALAERRKVAKDRIQRAKKTRIVKRTLGLTGTNKVDISDVQSKLAAAADGDV